jgi:hypothetical protein
MGLRRGTGFTNLNKVVNANKGNRLGSTVAGGISTQNQGVNTGIQTAQQNFQTEAEKNRLDNDESKEKREQVLGRFDMNAYTPDTSNFQASSGLQQQYQSSQQAYQQQQEQLKKTQAEQQAQVNAQIKSNQDALASAQAKINLGGFAAVNGRSEQNRYNTTIASLQGVNNLINQTTAAQEAAISKQLSDLETQYGAMTAAEKDKFIKDQRMAYVASNLPNDQEIADFANYRTGTYAGPTQLQDATSLYGKALQTEQLGGLSRSAGGQQELLRRFVGQGDYTQGQRNLDSVLLGQDADGVRAASRDTRGATGRVAEANQQAQGLAKEYVGRAQQFGNETRGMIQSARDPFSQDLDQRTAAAQQAETARQNSLATYTSALDGTDPKYAGMDQWTRTGLVLQDAANKGYLSPEETQQLMGSNGQAGLLQRAASLGLDPSAMLKQRIQNNAAQNVTRTGVATAEDVARLNALDRLAGKTGSDLEFQDTRALYDDGGIGFNASNLQDYISRTEAERGVASPVATGGSGGSTPGLGQTLINDAKQVGGSTLNMILNPQDGLTNPGNVVENVGNIIQGAGNTAIATTAAANQARDSILNGIMGISVNGKSLQDTAVGQQLSKIMGSATGLENAGLGAASSLIGGTASSLQNLGKGNISQSIEDLLTSGKAAVEQGLDAYNRSDVGKATTAVSNAIGRAASGFGAGQTGNWATSELNTVDVNTGKPAKIGTFANQSSQNILKQILSQQQLGVTSAAYNSNSAKKAEGAKMLNQLIQYYNAAVAREGGQQYSDKNLKEEIQYSDKDVTSFLDRLKPASYDYKEEVRNDPRASKDRQIGVMAQDLEKSKLGKESVSQGDKGKIVDYKDLQPKMLASLASLNNRLKKMEGKE